MSIFMPVPSCFDYILKLKKMRLLGLFFFLQIVLAIWGFIMIPYEFMNAFSISVKIVIGILIEILMNLYGYFNTISSVHEHGMSFSFSCAFFHQFHSFQCTSLSPPCLDLFLSILLYMMLLSMGFFFLISFSACSLIVYRKTSNICMLIFVIFNFTKLY